MRQVLNSLVELLSSLGLSFGNLRHSQRTFARLAREVDAAAAHLAGATEEPDEADLSALVARLREVASDTDAATAEAALDLDRIQAGLIRATSMVAEMTRNVMRPHVPTAAATRPWSPDPLERHLRDVICEARPGHAPGG